MPNNNQNDEAQFYSSLLKAFFDSANDAIFVLCDEMKFITCNKMTQDWLGLTEDELTAHNKRTPITELIGNLDAVDYFKSSIERALKNEDVFFETLIKPLKGKKRWIELSMKRVDIENGDMVIAVARDITDRKIADGEKDRLQRELSQSQKMEALGQLTGGIAHDFNNILGIICGYAELAFLRYKNKNDPLLIKYLNNILQSSNRAKKFISQMLLFSRNDITESEPLQLAPLIEEDIKMIKASMPSSIEFDISYEKNIPDVLVEPVKFQQLLLNIYINAKDAMKDRGKISTSLGLSRAIYDECSSCHKQIKGEWIELTITDTGSGISADIINRIFEPFFTTKSVGKGTGMGMAMVGSIMESMNGHIIVKSEPDKGTSFHLFFPPATDHDCREFQNVDKPMTETIVGHGESILIVDDEHGLVDFMSEMLEVNGYLCTSKTSSSDALDLYISDPEAFDLVLTDQTMPELTGIDLIEQMRRIKPEQSVILATGYSEAVDRKMAEAQGIKYIQKPFKTTDLLGLVKQALISEQ